jgi:hypothetical protein
VVADYHNIGGMVILRLYRYRWVVFKTVWSLVVGGQTGKPVESFNRLIYVRSVLCAALATAYAHTIAAGDSHSVEYGEGEW